MNLPISSALFKDRTLVFPGIFIYQLSQGYFRYWTCLTWVRLKYFWDIFNLNIIIQSTSEMYVHIAWNCFHQIKRKHTFLYLWEITVCNIEINKKEVEVEGLHVRSTGDRVIQKMYKMGPVALFLGAQLNNCVSIFLFPLFLFFYGIKW